MEKNTYFKEISYKEAIHFLLPKHYSGRKPNIKYAFGYFINDTLVRVCTFGIPASRSLCVGVCGIEFSSNVLELNRLLSIDDTSQLSSFVSKCLREISKKGDFIVVSYADTEMNHNGYIYQATNFIYTGKTAKRTDKYTEGNRHSRHYDKEAKEIYRKVRSSKHRYIYFCTKRKDIISSLKYNIQPYPKGNNSNYKLGDFLQPNVIKV